MTTVNEAILAIKTNVEADGGMLENLVTEWCNASEVEIGEQGDIWIANPQRGHWPSDERKREFVEWCNAQ
jgi:hypothetical protein